MTHIQEYFVPEENAEARKWTILKPALETASSAIRRRLAATSGEQSSTAPPCPPSLPACRDFSTWASNRDLWQWISKFRFLYRDIQILWQGESIRFSFSSLIYGASFHPTGSNFSCRVFQRTRMSTTHFRTHVVLLLIGFFF